MTLLALVKGPASIARYLAAVGEATDVPRRSPGRGPPYWKSRVLRLKVLGDGMRAGVAVAGQTRWRSNGGRQRGADHGAVEPARCAESGRRSTLQARASGRAAVRIGGAEGGGWSPATTRLDWHRPYSTYAPGRDIAAKSFPRLRRGSSRKAGTSPSLTNQADSLCADGLDDQPALRRRRRTATRGGPCPAGTIFPMASPRSSPRTQPLSLSSACGPDEP